MLTIYITSTVFLTMFLSQSVKYLARFVKRKRFSAKHLVFTYLWASGAPSTHTSIMFSTLTQMILFFGLDSPIVLVTLLFMSYEIYRILNQRKGYEAFEALFGKILDKKANEQDFYKLKDMLGHSIFDIIMGALLGTFIGVVAYHYYGNSIKPLIVN